MLIKATLLAVPALLIAAAGPGHAESPGVLWDCRTLSPTPTSIDLNCTHADAFGTKLKWNGNTAKGLFGYPACGPDCRTVLIRARFVVNRPVVTSAGLAYSTLRIRLLANKYHRHGQPKVIRYVLSCDAGQGWLPRHIADPC